MSVRRIGGGVLRKKTGENVFETVSYEMRFLGIGDLPLIMTLQGIVARNLPDHEIFRIDPEEYFRKHFSGPQNVIGVISEGELAAYCVISFPGIEEDNFGRDIGLAPEALSRVAHLETMAVHPAYRGNSLQRKIGRIHLGILQAMRCEHILCTVFPKNYPSLRNLFFFDFTIRALKIKYNWMLRYILYKNIRNPVRLTPAERIWVENSDAETQRELIERGYAGFEAVRGNGEDFKIAYGR